MAVVTWDGSASTDFAADANWDTGSAPDGTSDVVIPDTSSINNPTLGADTTINSLTLSANATLVGNASYTITCDGEADGTGATTSGYAVHMAGNGTIGTDLNITVTTAASTLVSLVPASGTVKNFTYNASGQQCSGVGATTINGDLTITAGTFQMYNDVALTVTGDVSVTGTLTGNASAISMGSLTIADGGTYTGTSGTTTITSEKASTGFAWKNEETDGTGFAHNNGTVTITTGATTHIMESSFYNLTINQSGQNFYWRDSASALLTIHNNLSVTGNFYRNTAGDTLTVTGDVTIPNNGVIGQASESGANNFGSLTIESGGTYVATSGTTTITSEKTSSGYAWYNVSGTYTHNNGTVNFTSTADTHLRDDTFYNLTITGGASSSDFYYRPKDGGTGAVTIANDLTIVEGLFRPAGAAGALTVTGDVSIESGGVLGQDDSSGAMTFGSLTIASGGTYSATSGTTTLNGGGANGDASTSLHGTGTFTHNKGTLHFASGAQYRIPLGGTFYNVTTDVQLYGYAGSLSPQAKMPDGTTATDFISIEGTFRINNASVYPYSWDGLYVHNLIIGDGTGSANSAKLSLAESDVFNGTVYVDNVTINSDGQFLFGDGDETSATAGSSALNIYGSFRNLGGNVTIE